MKPTRLSVLSALTRVISPRTKNPQTITMAPKVWLVIGCSSGFGEEIASQALDRGDKVIATSRTPDKLVALAKRGAETIKLEVCDSDKIIQNAIKTAVDKAGRLDILVNNAGYILIGTVDQCTSVALAYLVEPG
jgi:NADP-dependent 3-hydroxy acid dehydrogenase YdfG